MFKVGQSWELQVPGYRFQVRCPPATHQASRLTSPSYEKDFPRFDYDNQKNRLAQQRRLGFRPIDSPFRALLLMIPVSRMQPPRLLNSYGVPDVLLVLVYNRSAPDGTVGKSTGSAMGTLPGNTRHRDPTEEIDPTWGRTFVDPNNQNQTTPSGVEASTNCCTPTEFQIFPWFLSTIGQLKATKGEKETPALHPASIAGSWPGACLSPSGGFLQCRSNSPRVRRTAFHSPRYWKEYGKRHSMVFECIESKASV